MQNSDTDPVHSVPATVLYWHIQTMLQHCLCTVQCVQYAVCMQVTVIEIPLMDLNMAELRPKNQSGQE